MGKITEALKKVTDERLTRIQKKPVIQYIVKKIANTNVDQHVVAYHDPSSPISEQFKMLRTNIQSMRREKNYKTFMITSTIDGEGKTITSLNLAITMAQDLNNKSILLIEADMRKSKIGKYLGISRRPGLSELLQDKVAKDEEVFVSPGIANLTIIMAGKKPSNPSELLNSKNMEKYLALFKQKFDYIFIDTPPVMPITDACILGPMVDGTLMVVQV
ncbi:capsular exopolysaccharide family protein, partial [sediment metagenome]